MKKVYKSYFLLLLTALAVVACTKDDTDFSDYDFSNYSLRSTTGDDDNDVVNTIYIVYNGSSASVTGDDRGYVSVAGADVTVNTGTDTDSLLLVLSGSTTDGSLLVYREKKYGIMLNGVTIHNADGPAINNQCKKSLFLDVASGTVNTLTDATAYTELLDVDGNVIDQKGTLFSEGQLYFMGHGTLRVEGSCKHAIACDDYVVFSDDVTLTATSATGNGIKVNDGIYIDKGTIDIQVTADGARGIKSDAVVVITGGTVAIDTQGDCVYDSDAADYSSAACIKCDADFTMSGGSLTMTSSGDGGKGLNCSTSVFVSGGTFSAVTTGTKEDAKPKAVKGTTGIFLSGGSFYAKAGNSTWACDNGTDSSVYSERVTIDTSANGSPITTAFAKSEVTVSW